MPPFIQENVPLAGHTTFHIGGNARFFIRAVCTEDIENGIRYAQKNNLPLLILGDGSNVLCADTGFDGVVIKIAHTGIQIEKETDDFVYLHVEAGEAWDAVVAYAVEHNLYGVENLSHIPGRVGASVVQNIGAYGVEVKEVVHAVHTYNKKDFSKKIFTNTECVFNYRNSFFKTKEGSEYVITSVVYKLKKDASLCLTYKDLKEYFKEKNPTLQKVRDAVIAIRARKFPNLKKEGCAGSFFKNPIITTEEYATIKEKYPLIPAYFNDYSSVKVSLAWILDNVCSLKNMCIGDACVYDKQTLVIVNKGNASARDVKKLVEYITDIVFEKTKIKIEREVLYV